MLPNSTDSLTCVLCTIGEETLQHLLIHCPISNYIWQLCHRWLGILTADPETCTLHFVQFGNELLTSKSRQGAKTVWLVMAWTIWLTRNCIIFSNGQQDSERMFELAQLRSWNWLRARHRQFKWALIHYPCTVLPGMFLNIMYLGLLNLVVDKLLAWRMRGSLLWWKKELFEYGWFVIRFLAGFKLCATRVV